MMRTDLAVHVAVSAALRAVLGSAAAEVTASVRDGVVTLKGVVNTPVEKAAAEQAIQRVLGVYAVAEELTVRSGQAARIDDEALARAALDALGTGLHPIGRDVTIRVENGWLSLGGTVASSTEYSAVERALECLSGVRGMSSEVRLSRADGKPSTSAVAPSEG